MPVGISRQGPRSVPKLRRAKECQHPRPVHRRPSGVFGPRRTAAKSRKPSDCPIPISTELAWVLPSCSPRREQLRQRSQIILAYFLNAYVPLAATIAFFAFGLVPSDFLNNFDRHFLRIKARRSASRWIEGFCKAYFAFNIQQLVFSIAVLVAGTVGISDAIVFDFHSVIYMALLSWTAHLLTSIHLRDRFLASPCFRTIELLTVLTILILLCAALFPTTNYGWSTNILTRAHCTKHTDCSGWQGSVQSQWQNARQSNGKGGLSPQGVLSYLILIGSFVLYATSLLWRKAKFARCLFKRLLVLLAQNAIRVSVRNHNNNKKKTPY